MLIRSWDRTAGVWDAATGKLLLTLKGHTDIVDSASFSPDGRTVATGSRDKTARLWDAAAGKPLLTLAGHTDRVWSASFSPDGRTVLTGSGDKTARLWDAATGKAILTLAGHTKPVNSASFSPDGKTVLTGSHDRTARLWDATTGKLIHSLAGHSISELSASFSSDGKSVLTWSSSRTPILWDAATGSLIHALEGHTEDVLFASFSPNGKTVMARARSISSATRFWDAATDRTVLTLVADMNEFNFASFSPDSKTVVTGLWDRTAGVWDAATGKLLLTLKGHTDIVDSASFSPDGRTVVTRSRDKTARLWDVATGKHFLTLGGHMDAILSASFSPDGRMVLTGCEDETARLWDAATGKLLRTLKGHTSYVTSASFSPDGRTVVTGSWDNTARLWDAATGKAVLTLRGHTSSVLSASFSPDGKTVLTGSFDKNARLWDAATGETILTLAGHTAAVESASFSPDGRTVLTGSKDGTIRVWNSSSGRELRGRLAVGDEWLAWTPEGYYHCSPGAEKLMAWKLADATDSRGYRIVGPEQFRKQFYRPDLFPHLLAEGDLTAALAKTDKEARRPVEAPSSIAKAIPPVVIITDPKRDGDTDRESIAVEATAVSVGDNPVTKMRILVNGRPYQGTRSDFDIPNPRLGKVSFKKEIELVPGENTIQVIGECAVSEGRSDVLKIKRTDAVVVRPKMYVLAVGVTAYAEKDLRKGVYYCSADAKRFADTLEKSSGPLYGKIEVIRLIDEGATRRKILQALESIAKKATQNDVVMIFFAGHGDMDLQKTFYFLPVDAEKGEIAATAISEGDFKAQVRKIAGRVVLMLDACHSGKLVELTRGTDSPTDKLYRDLTSNEYGLVVMCSSRGVQLSQESNALKAGLFTTAVVEGLGGRARKTNGAIYFKDLDAYVTERVKDLSEGKQHPLTSQTTGISNIPLTQP